MTSGLGLALVGAASSAGAAAPAGPNWPVVVANSGTDTLSVIGPSGTSSVTVRAGPYAIAITPSGTTAYVATNAGIVDIVNGINTNTPTLSSTTLTVGTTPAGIAISPDGSTGRHQLGCGHGQRHQGREHQQPDRLGHPDGREHASRCRLHTERHHRVRRQQRRHHAQRHRRPQHPNALGLLEHADGGRRTVGDRHHPRRPTAYSPLGCGTVSVIKGVSTSNPTVSSATLTVGTHPLGIALTPGGATAYVTDEGSGNVSVIAGTNTATPTVGSTPLVVGSEPESVAVAPDGRTAYVTNFGANTVSVINGANTITPSVASSALTVGSEPVGIAVVAPPTGYWLTGGDGGISRSAFPSTAQPATST